MKPVEPPAGDAVVIRVLLTLVKFADTPLKETSVALVKLTPVIVTGVPTGPASGTTDVIEDDRKKFTSDVAVPLVVVTVIGPLVALAGTVEVMLVEDGVPTMFATTPLNFTMRFPLGEPLKPEPLMTTLVPTFPFGGLKLRTVGSTTKLEVVMVELGGASMEIFPVVALLGTVKTMFVWLLLTIVALALPIRTALRPAKLRPEMVTLLPTCEAAGKKLVITGGTKKLVMVVFVPLVAPVAMEIVMGPVMVFAGTKTCIWLSLLMLPDMTFEPLNFTVGVAPTLN